jgi:hypothetical protein
VEFPSHPLEPFGAVQRPAALPDLGRQTEQACVQQNDRWGLAVCLCNLGLVRATLGQPQLALACYEQALRIAQEVNHLDVIQAAAEAIRRLRSGDATS